jgi:hypothetical protein
MVSVISWRKTKDDSKEATTAGRKNLIGEKLILPDVMLLELVRLWEKSHIR